MLQHLKYRALFIDPGSKSVREATVDEYVTFHFFFLLQSHETKDLPSPMVGSQFDLNDSLDVDAQNMALSGMNNSWMSSVSLDSTSTSSTFEKYSLTALQMV